MNRHIHNYLNACFLIFLFIISIQLAKAHESADVYVRVVNANPETQTYTFSCESQGSDQILRDWFIKTDDGRIGDEPNEVEILDQNNKTLTYTFKTTGFYHIACLLYNDQTATLTRGDTHIDLRPTNDWSPKITLMNSSANSSTLLCSYNGTNSSEQNWEVVDARTGIKSQLGSANPLIHSVSGHGIYDYICNIATTGTGLPIEYFDQGLPYVPDKFGIPHGVTTIWIRNTSSTNTTNSSNTAYTNIKNLPATCEGGIITSDIYMGGRDITCASGSNLLRVTAWDKPTSANPEYFEMYKQNQTGAGVKICLANTCIATNGYAKSPNYPIYITNSTNATNTTNTNVTNTTNTNTTNTTTNATNTNSTNATNTSSNTSNASTYSSIQSIPANCTGTITSDTFAGARHITCVDGPNSVSIEGWDKPTSTNPQYFELYKKNQTGNNVKVCVANTCIFDNGYAKSQNYPIIIANTSSTNTTNSSTNTSANTSTNTSTGPNVTYVAHYNLQYIPAQCEGGTITDDTYNGGRAVSCKNGAAELHILAWDKPTTTNPDYFEMYKQSQIGAGLKICLASTCISDNGFARSQEYPILVSSLQPMWYSTNDDDVAPNYFHLELQQPQMTTIVSTDFEVWHADELIWTKRDSSELFHVHTPDGTFVNSYAAKTQLDYSTAYVARSRYKLSDGTYSAWSANKYILTLDAPQATQSDEWLTPAGFKVETVATGFDYPVHVAMAPPGMYGSLPDDQEPLFYVTELYGKVKVVHKDFSQATFAADILNFDPFGSITGGGQMGVVGLYIDNDTGDLFVGTTYVDANNSIKNKIIRFQSADDGNSYYGQTVVIDNLPSSASHQVEQITKGPDGKLYVGLGDALVSSNAQSDSILAGKIIRMNMDGSNVEVYAKGFRNPFGLDWRPGYNTLFATDNAPDADDRVVKVLQGQNYGWGLNDNFTTWHAKTIYYTDVSPVDVEFNAGNVGFPTELTGKMYVAVAGPVYTAGPTPHGKIVWELTLDGNGNVTQSRQFLKYNGSGYGTPMGLDFGSDGLYVTDIYGEAGSTGYGSEGRVLRISQGNASIIQNRTATFRTNIFISPWYPKLIGNQTEYEFTCNPIDGSGNYTYDWLLGDGDALYNDNYNKKLHTYPYSNNEYNVVCTAHDLVSGQSTSANMTINPSKYIAEQQ